MLRILFATILLLPLWLSAQDRLMAVVDVQVQGDAKKYISDQERQYLSTAIRSQASQVLGSQVEILSQAKFKKLVKANAEGCSEAGCFAGFIAEIGVDLGMQPTISYAFGKLKMTLEVADNRATLGSRTLSAPPTEEGKNQLGEQAEIAAKELFTEVATRLKLQPTTQSELSNSTNNDDDLTASTSSSSEASLTSTTVEEENSYEERSSSSSVTVQRKLKDDSLVDSFKKALQFKRTTTKKEEPKAPKDTEDDFDDKGFNLHVFMNMGFASFNEALMGTRIELAYKKLGVYFGVGIGTLGFSLFDYEVFPVAGMRYKSKRNTFAIQAESIIVSLANSNAYTTYDKTTTWTNVQFIYHRDILGPKGLGYLVGIGSMIENFTNSAYPEQDYEDRRPMFSAALTYQFR